jgi:tRNA(fMet)-specific endonuclease VapC
VTLRYLLDTNVISAAFRPSPPPKLLRKLRKHREEMALAAPVWHELRYGCALLPASRRREALERFVAEVVLPGYPILEYDRAAAEWHASERARLEQAGRRPPLIDAQIAAIAAVRGLTVVTDNTADFRPFDGLTLENWLV